MRFEFKVDLKKVRPVSKSRYMFNIKNEPLLRQHLVLAYQIQGVINEDLDKTLKQIAGWIGLTPARITQIMNLLFLAPDIQEEILLSEDKMLFYLPELKVEKVAQEIDWGKQKKCGIIRDTLVLTLSNNYHFPFNSHVSKALICQDNKISATNCHISPLNKTN